MLAEVLKVVFTECLEDTGDQVTYDLDFIENKPLPPRGLPTIIGADNEETPLWLKDVRAVATEHEKQDDPQSHPLTLMVRK